MELLIITCQLTINIPPLRGFSQSFAESYSENNKLKTRTENPQLSHVSQTKLYVSFAQIAPLGAKY